MPTVKLDPAAPEETREGIAKATRELEQTAAAEPVPVPRTRSLAPRSMEAIPAPRRLEAKKMARRSVITGDAIRKQQDANSVMLDTLSKYGMDGQVALMALTRPSSRPRRSQRRAPASWRSTAAWVARTRPTS
jgi:serine protease